MSDHIIEWDPPFYFVARWEGLTIYGHRIDSPYEEDQEYMRTLAARGVIYTESFSVACPQGELGSWGLHQVTAISKEQFEEARRRQWSDAPDGFGLGRKASGWGPRSL